MNEKTYKVGDMQVWWIPQVPMKSFKIDVYSVEEAAKIMDVLAEYDLFQFNNNIKPDYFNIGGLRVWMEDDGDGVEGWND